MPMKLSRRGPRPWSLAHTLSASSIALAIGATALLPGCSWWSSPSSDANVGQQLANLRKSLDAGAITREEYERERRRIIGNW